jgi:hypothetical protein
MGATVAFMIGCSSDAGDTAKSGLPPTGPPPMALCGPPPLDERPTEGAVRPPGAVLVPGPDRARLVAADDRSRRRHPGRERRDLLGVRAVADPGAAVKDGGEVRDGDVSAVPPPVEPRVHHPRPIG